MSSDGEDTVRLVRRVKCLECGYETRIALGVPANASHGEQKCRGGLRPVGEAYIVGSRGPVRAPVLDGVESSDQHPQCNRPACDCLPGRCRQADIYEEDMEPCRPGWCNGKPARPESCDGSCESSDQEDSGA